MGDGVGEFGMEDICDGCFGGGYGSGFGVGRSEVLGGCCEEVGSGKGRIGR